MLRLPQHILESSRPVSYSHFADRYYWINLGSDVDTFVANCRQCNWSQTPGLLHPLPIGERCWQHVSFDFKAMPKDRNGYDNVFMIIDHLGKRAFSLPCTREATAMTVAKLYYEYPWRITRWTLPWLRALTFMGAVRLQVDMVKV